MFAPIARKIESGIMAFCRENQDSIEKFQFNNIHSTIFSWKYFSYFVKNVENMSDTEIKKLLLVTGEIDTFKANGNSQYLIGWESSISEI